jgi:hypothetical protein
MSLISPSTTIAYVNTGLGSRTLTLPSSSNIQGKYITIKDGTGQAFLNTITVQTSAGDLFETGGTNQVITRGYGFATFFVRSNTWYAITDSVSATNSTNNTISTISTVVSYGLSSLVVSPGVSSLSSLIGYGLSSVYSPQGISSLSSIVSYGLSTLIVAPGISSLSSLVSYGLSSVYSPQGLSSLSTIVSYGLSTLVVAPGISSLSSIVSYGLSTLVVAPGISSLSTIVSYGLSSLIVAPGISSLSSVVSYGLSTVWSGVIASNTAIRGTLITFSTLSSMLSYGLSSVQTTINVSNYSNTTYNIGTCNSYVSNYFIDSNTFGVSSLSTIMSYGLSSIVNSPNGGVSSLSSIISYGLSSLGAQGSSGVSSLSSIVSYGFSSLVTAPGVSSLSSILSYGLSSLVAAPGISSLSSIVSYGLSSLITAPGISSLSSIISYGLSSLVAAPGISSLSSIVSYGLSSLRTSPGISSLSSIVSYGLSTLVTAPGISSLSSVVSYGLSTLIVAPGLSSLSSIVSYGLSTLIVAPGVSSLSSITSYGLSSLQNVLLGYTSNFATSNLYTSSIYIVPGRGPTYDLILAGETTTSYVQQYSLATNNFVARNLESIGQITSIYNNGDIIVGGGSGTLGYSRNGGVTWLNAASANPFANGSINWITYENGTWVAVGSNGTNGTNLAYSYDGIYWVPGGTSLVAKSDGSSSANYGPITSIAYNSNNNYWMATAGAVSQYSSNNTSRIYRESSLFRINSISQSSPYIQPQSDLAGGASYGFSNGGVSIKWGSSNWVATGFDSATNFNIQYSSNGGVSFLPASNITRGTNTFFLNRGGATMDYGNGIFLVGGGSNELYKSTDGINFSNIFNNFGTYPDLIPNLSGQSAANITSNYLPKDWQIYDIKYKNSNTYFVNFQIGTITSGASYNISNILTVTSNAGITWGGVINQPANTLLTRLSIGLSATNIIPSPIVSGTTINNTFYSPVINAVTAVASNTITNALVVNNYAVIPSLTSGVVVASTINAVNIYTSTVSSFNSYASYYFGDGTGIVNVRNPGVSSLSSIVSFGLSTLVVAPGLSSLSSIVSYGLSSLIVAPGVSSISSLVGYGLSSLRTDPGISSLSSIVSYGLSSLIISPGVSSLSSLVGYGLSSLRTDPGVSSLSSIVSYGLSSLVGVIGQGGGQGISSLSSIVSYGLSTLVVAPGVSSLSSIVSYGLSTVWTQSQLLGSNTYNYTFRASSIGGTDVQDAKLNPTSPDLIVNAFAKVDNWLFQNMIAPPPAPIFARTSNTATTCTVTWSNPYQFQTGFLPQPFPFINRLLLNIVSTDGFSITSNITTASNMPFPGNPNVISNALLANDVGNFTSGYANNTFIIANAGSAGKSNFTFNITWLNNNTMLASNTLIVSGVNFATASVPSAPVSVSYSINAPTTITFTYSDPSAPGGTLGGFCNTTVTFSNLPYTNTFTATSATQPGPRRYQVAFTPATVTTFTTYTSGTKTFQRTSLLPDTPVVFSVSASNILAVGYGPAGIAYGRTALPTAPSRLGTITFGNNYATQGIPITSRNAASPGLVTIMNCNLVTAQYALSATQTNIAIHTASNPGSTSNSIMRLTWSNSAGGAGADVTFNGYGGATPAPTTTTADGNFQITYTSITDLAPSTYSGFYNGLVSLTFAVARCNIAPRPTVYTLTAIQSNEFNPTNVTQSVTLYTDSINVVPTLLETYNTILTTGITYFHCSGILSFNSNLLFNSVFRLSNIGYNFLTYPNIGNYQMKNGAGTNLNTLSNTLSSNQFYSDIGLAPGSLIPTTATLVNSNIFVTSNISFLSNQTVFTNRAGTNILNLVTSFSNIFGTTGVASNEFKIYSNAGFCNIYFDIPSKIVLDSMNTSNSIYGIRVLSGTGVAPATYGGVFDQTATLVGTNELQLVNGLFQTNASPTDGYINYSIGGFHNPISGSYTYPNYTGFTTTDTRYVTTQYYKVAPTGVTYTFLNLTIMGGVNITTDFNNYLQSNITVEYKIIEPLYPAINPATHSTGWLNGNVFGIVNATNKNDGQGGFVPSQTINGTLYTSSTSNRLLQVTGGTGEYPFITYIRVGVQMNQNVKWQRISITFL